MTATVSEIHVCRIDDLTPGLGAAALVEGEQVALFRLDDGTVHAVQNMCPFADAAVISRGITGDRGGEPTICSPLYKQVFSLVTGECLVTMDKEPVHTSPDLTVYPVTVRDGDVLVTVVRSL
ncbi:nitrite reductase small subunit NirD [Demequina sp. B12]|uniref:nitrite reductase small subunit NirD n=1 Tax=Demequina sp. B12 TaxID=2992757 RepID=UPI00237B105E|nr:nitrite reductase small subunit NirD [Demequina sp. B12]MDE0572825.1 nitrite reductase small subunit NirD [Demequina sp. B12]